MADKQTILIAGGSGLIGKKLQARFVSEGHEVRLLGRGYKGSRSRDRFYWDPSKGEMDGEALRDVTWLVNLAGAAVAGERWTERRKKEIMDSRVDSTRLLVETIRETGYKPGKVLSASAVGYYGAVTVPVIFTENSKAGTDFLARVCVQWEAEAARFRTELGIPVVIIRIGVVLAREGGALQQIVKPMRMLAGAVPGSGKQWVPWIHIDDLAGIMHYTLQQPGTEGVYNGVSLQYTNFEQLGRAAARSLHKILSPVNVPGFLIRLALGEQAGIVLEGSRVSAEKIGMAGYPFRYVDIQTACDHLLK